MSFNISSSLNIKSVWGGKLNNTTSSLKIVFFIFSFKIHICTIVETVLYITTKILTVLNLRLPKPDIDQNLVIG